MVVLPVILAVSSTMCLLGSMNCLLASVFTDKWQSIRVDRENFFRVTNTPPTPLEVTAMFNLTLPPFPVPNCTCVVCPNTTFYINITFPSPTTTPTTTKRTKKYRTTRSRRTRSTPTEPPPPPPPRRTRSTRGIRLSTTTTEATTRRRKPYPGYPWRSRDELAEKNFLLEMDEVKPDSVPNNKTDHPYFSRTVGLFRVCFRDERPPGHKRNCSFFNFGKIEPHGTSRDSIDLAWRRLHLLRATAAFLIMSLLVAFSVFCAIYVVGCLGWSPIFLGILSLMLLAAFLFGVIAMASFHGAEIAERKSWGRNLRAHVTVEYDFSYALAWVGILLCLLSAALLNLLAARMRKKYCLHPQFALYTTKKTLKLNNQI